MELKSEGRSVPTESEIVKSIDECAEELKNFAVEKRVIKSVCGPVYASAVRVLEANQEMTIEQRTTAELDRMVAEIETRKKETTGKLAEARSDVEKEWSLRKTELVPGDMLLDRVMKRSTQIERCLHEAARKLKLIATALPPDPGCCRTAPHGRSSL